MTMREFCGSTPLESGHLDHYYLKCGPEGSTIAITYDLVRNALSLQNLLVRSFTRSPSDSYAY